MKCIWALLLLIYLPLLTGTPSKKRCITLEEDEKLLSVLAGCAKKEQDIFIEYLSKSQNGEIDIQSLKEVFLEYCEAKKYEYLLNLGKEVECTEEMYL